MDKLGLPEIASTDGSEDGFAPSALFTVAAVKAAISMSNVFLFIFKFVGDDAPYKSGGFSAVASTDTGPVLTISKNSHGFFLPFP